VSAARAADAARLSKRVEFLSITVGPGREAPHRLAAYRKFYDPGHRFANWELLTGPRAHITRLWRQLGVFWTRVPEDTPPDRDWLTHRLLTYDIAQADEVIAFDGRGHERFVISGHSHVPKSGDVPAKMRTFLNDQGRRHLYHPDAEAWTPGDVLQAVGWLTRHRVSSS
jgi:cytochrome oxidase Cu insertion factor (SCO1/SenC/PrrC family)